MPATEVKAIRSVTGSYTFTEREYQVTYRVTMDSDTADPKEVLDSLPFKVLDPVWTYQYEDAEDANALVYEIGAPRRELGGKSKNVWLVEVRYVFNSNEWPEYIPVRVTPSYMYENSTIQSAVFQGWYKLNQSTLFYDEQDEAQFPNPLLTSAGETPLPPEGPTVGPIVNSGGIPLIPSPTQRVAITRLRVEWTRYDYQNYDPFINTVNAEPYTLIAYDRPLNPAISHRGDAARVVFQQTFQPNQLLFNDVQCSTVYMQGRICYEYSVDFIYKLNHFRYELDQGISSRSGENEPNGSGSRWGSEDVQEEQLEAMRFKYLDGTPVTEPVMMDGMGKPIIPSNPNEAIYLGWQIYPKVDFNLAEIGLAGSRT